MPESETHRKLVQHLYQYVLSNWLTGQESIILLDAASFRKPPTINGFIPDLLGWNPATRLLVIGEAETAASIQALHAEAQIAAFSGRCAQERNSVLLLAVPWYMVPYARGLLRSIQRTTNSSTMSVVVIEELGL